MQTINELYQRLFIHFEIGSYFVDIDGSCDNRTHAIPHFTIENRKCRLYQSILDHKMFRYQTFGILPGEIVQCVIQFVCGQISISICMSEPVRVLRSVFILATQTTKSIL